jgi:hypothetical protein
MFTAAGALIVGIILVVMLVKCVSGGQSNALPANAPQACLTVVPAIQQKTRKKQAKKVVQKAI